MPYDVGVSQYLQGKGVSSNDIGYDSNNQNVTIKGQPFYKPELNMAGTTYSSQPNLDNAYSNYTKQQAQGVGTMNGLNSAGGVNSVKDVGTDTGIPKPASTGYTNPYTQMIGDLIKHLSDTSNAPAPDIYSSPQYAAAKANQDRQSADAVRHANESAAGAGLGHSTIMTDRSQRIQDDSNNYLQTQLVPQIMSQLQAQRQTEMANERAHLNDIIGLSDRADSQHNVDRTFDAGRQDAATTATGIFNPSGKSVQEVQAKMDENSKAYATATPEEQQKLHDENLQLASQLGKTFDPNTGKYSEGQGFVGTKTVAQKQLDLNNVKDMAILTGRMPDGTLTNAAQQQQLTNQWTLADQTGSIPNSLADFYGLPHGMQTQAAKNQAAQIAISGRNADISQQNADTSSANGLASRDNMKADNTRQDNAVKLSADGRAAQGTIMGDLPKLTSDPATAEANIKKYFDANAAHFGPIIGADAYDKMKQQALAPYQKVTPADKQDTTIREKAITAAQKDMRWDKKGQDRAALITEYESYYK